MRYLAAFLASTVLWCPAKAGAQDNDEVEQLKKRVAVLERKLASWEHLLQRILIEGLPKVQKELAPQLVQAKTVLCGNRLSQLWRLQHIYIARFGGKKRLMPSDTGRDFWLALTNTQPPLIGPDNTDLLICPLSGSKALVGFTDYRGPAKNVRLLGAGDPVGCCEPGSHPDGKITVLLKSGDVQVVQLGDELYQKAIQGTSP